MSKVDQPIEAIFGFEPMREGEYPTSFTVGQYYDGRYREKLCERITFREDNYGTHGVGWFDVWSGGEVVRSLNACAVAEVYYAPPKEEG